MKILIYGAGYVGLANGLALSKGNQVTLCDINEEIVNNLRKGIVHIDDPLTKEEISKFTNIKFELNSDVVLSNFALIILALPTNYDEETNSFDTSLLDNQISKIREQTQTTIMIKSTIPIGYTDSMNGKYGNIIFSPEFLREGSSLSDAMNPTRIILGTENEDDIKYAKVFQNISLNDPKIIIMSPRESESVKLFSNTYLAMRVAFVNELASFAEITGLNTNKIIDGVSEDPRIGAQYFSPSAGYGGYCLPKDSKQLMQEFKKLGMPNDLLEGIVRSNENRKDNIVRVALKSGEKKVTINGIGHKPGVSNYRNSQNLWLAKKLKNAGIEVEIIDENFSGKTIDGFLIK